MSDSKKVYVTVVSQPTVETLTAVVKAARLRNAEMRRRIERDEARERTRKEAAQVFNGIRGLATVKL